MKGWCVVLAPVLAIAVGCASSYGEDVTESASPACVAPGTEKAPGVSLRGDLVPILNRSCAFSSCHGSGAKNGISLKGDPTTIRTRLVGGAADGSPMPYVTAHDPEQSFLMRKLEGSLCEGGGERMPKGNDPLSLDEQAKFRGWIADGAPDN